MHVTKLTDQFDAVAALLGTTPGEARDRFAGNGAPSWLAIDGGTPVGLATARARPDRRTFLAFTVAAPAAYGPLARAAAATCGDLHAAIDAADREAESALQACGFVTEVVTERFLVPFDRALTVLGRARPASGFTILGADEADEGRLFTLDNAIRQDVPGSDGWRGDRAWFREELADSPPFDPAAYLVAVDDGNGEYAGLVRIWRNRSGPRLGLVGVLRQYRGTPVAGALLQRAVSAAAGWGHEAFHTETSPANRAVHPHLVRLGAVSQGRSVQLRRRVSRTAGAR